MVTFLGRFTWQKEGEVALIKLIARPLSLGGEYLGFFSCLHGCSAVNRP